MTLMKKKRGISDDEEHELNYEACLLAMICIKKRKKNIPISKFPYLIECWGNSESPSAPNEESKL